MAAGRGELPPTSPPEAPHTCVLLARPLCLSFPNSDQESQGSLVVLVFLVPGELEMTGTLLGFWSYWGPQRWLMDTASPVFPRF